MYDVQLHHVGASRHDKTDFDTILLDEASRSHIAPRSGSNKSPMLRCTLTVAATLILLGLLYTRQLRVVLNATHKAATWLATQQQQHPSIAATTVESLQTLPLQVALRNVTGDVDTVASLLHAFFKQTDPSLESRFKLYVQQHAAQRCVHW